MSVRAALSAYRWPLYITGILLMSVVAQGVLVYVATRPDTPRPMQSFYARSLEWDADAAVAEASQQLGWSVQYEVPTDLPHAPGMPRPVDVVITDRDGQPVSGLTGQLAALRPADARLSNRNALTEIPHLPGRYRSLLRLDRPGMWEFRVDTNRGALRFVHKARVSLVDAPAATEGAGP